MSILEIIEFPHDVLREEAAPLEGINDAIEQLARDMIETMYHAPGSGLAANQVGVAKQVIVVDGGAGSDPDEGEEPPGPVVVVNPRIVELSDETVCAQEGCLSVPDYSAEVERSLKVALLGKTLAGDDVRIEAEGWLARVFQHEIDHLAGTLYIDHIGRLKRQRYIKKRKKELGGKK